MTVLAVTVNGRERLSRIINEQLARLKNTKYGVFIIGHNKIKSVKEKNGDEYSILTSNLTADYFNTFAYVSDIICNITTEKEIDNGTLQDIKRYMYFKSDGMVDAGSRFPSLPNRIEFGAKNYINAVLEGIKNSKNKEMTEKEFEKQIKVDRKEKEDNAKKFAEAENKQDDDELIKLCIETIKAGDANIKSITKDFIVKYGYANIKELESGNNKEHIKELAVILDIIKE